MFAKNTKNRKSFHILGLEWPSDTKLEDLMCHVPLRGCAKFGAISPKVALFNTTNMFRYNHKSD